MEVLKGRSTLAGVGAGVWALAVRFTCKMARSWWKTALSTAIVPSVGAAAARSALAVVEEMVDSGVAAGMAVPAATVGSSAAMATTVATAAVARDWAALFLTIAARSLFITVRSTVIMQRKAWPAPL